MDVIASHQAGFPKYNCGFRNGSRAGADKSDQTVYGKYQNGI